MVRAHSLGRGLDALIPPRETAPVEEISIDAISPNPHQPREHFDEGQLTELTDSIREHGVLQPILVRERLGGGYELIAGERRLRAARRAGLSRIPAIIRASAGSDQLELALTENLQRADLGPLESAEAYRELIDRFGLSHETVARRVGKSRAAISNALRLLELAPQTRQALAEGHITEGHARALASLTVASEQASVLQLVVQRRMSVRHTEELVRRSRTAAPRPSGPRSTELGPLEDALRRLLATKVTVARSRRGGRLVIDFYSDEELDRIFSIITRGNGAPA